MRRIPFTVTVLTPTLEPIVELSSWARSYSAADDRAARLAYAYAKKHGIKEYEISVQYYG